MIRISVCLCVCVVFVSVCVCVFVFLWEGKGVSVLLGFTYLITWPFLIVLCIVGLFFLAVRVGVVFVAAWRCCCFRMFVYWSFWYYFFFWVFFVSFFHSWLDFVFVVVEVDFLFVCLFVVFVVVLLSSPGKFCSGLTCWVPGALGRVGATPRTPPAATGAPWAVAAPRWAAAAACPTAGTAACSAGWAPRRLMLPRWPTTRPRGTVIPCPRPAP